MNVRPYLSFEGANLQSPGPDIPLLFESDTADLTRTRKSFPVTRLWEKKKGSVVSG
jgi:hypothetical protein